MSYRERGPLFNRNEVVAVLVGGPLLLADAYFGTGVTKIGAEVVEGLVDTGRSVHEWAGDQWDKWGPGGEPESGALGSFATAPEAIIVPLDAAAPSQ